MNLNFHRVSFLGRARFARPVALIVSVSTALTAASLASVPAGHQPKGDAPPAGRSTVFAVEHMDLDHILVDPRDAGLKRALRMIPARLKELPGEIPNFDMPPQVLDLLGRLMGRSMRMGLAYDGANQQGGFFGAGMVMAFGATDEKDAVGIQQAIADLLKMAPGGGPPIEASKDVPGMSEIATPIGVVRFGPAKSAEGWRFEVRVGGSDGATMFKDLDATTIKGAATFVRATFDGGPLTPLVAMLANLAGGGQGEMLMKQLEESGMIGPDAVQYRLAMGHGESGFVSTMRAIGMGKHAARTGGKSVLSAEDLRLLPGDTVAGSVSKLSIKPIIDELEKAVQGHEQAERMLATIRKELEFDPIEDVLKSLGDVGAFYMSDSTGGGSLGSAVGVIGLKDSKRLSGALSRFATRFNSEMKNRNTANGYVRIKPWTADGMSYWSLQTPGLPLPVEITWCITDKHLVMGFTPQACMGAVRQATGKGDGGLMAGAGKGAFPSGREFNTVSFSDTPRLVRRGYPILCMAGSALANAVRSRNGDRDPGVIVPTFSELAVHLKPAVACGYWDGDDYVTESTADRSMMVNLASAIGGLSEFMPVIVAAAAAMGVAASEGRAVRMPPQPVPPPEKGDHKPSFMVVPSRGDDLDPGLPERWPAEPFGG